MGPHTDSKKAEFESIIEQMEKEFSSLKFTADENAIYVRPPDSAEEGIFRFEDPKLLRFLLLNLHGFESVSILGSKVCIMVEDRFFGILTFPGWRVRNAVSEISFKLSYEGEQLNVRFLHLPQRLTVVSPYLQEGVDVRRDGELIERTKRQLEAEEPLPKYDVRTGEETSYRRVCPSEDDLITTLYGLLVGCLDRRDWSPVSLGGIFETDGLRITSHPLIPTHGEPLLSDAPPISGLETYLMIDTSSNVAVDALKKNWSEITDSILFSYYYSTGLLPSLVDLVEEPEPQTRTKQIEFFSPSLPGDSVFKRVNSTLIQYLLVAQRTNLSTFRYLSLFHILEYFFDRVVRQRIADEVRKIVSRPDFVAKRELYTSRIVKIAQETTKTDEEFNTEALKLMFVLQSLLSRDFLVNLPEAVKKHLSQELDFGEGHSLKPVIFPELQGPESELAKKKKNLDRDAFREVEDKALFSTFARRIYDLRCSIVHSNPDFPGHQKPLDLSQANLDKVEREAEILRLIACEVMSEASNLQIG